MGVDCMHMVTIFFVQNEQKSTSSSSGVWRGGDTLALGEGPGPLGGPGGAPQRWEKERKKEKREKRKKRKKKKREKSKKRKKRGKKKKREKKKEKKKGKKGKKKNDNYKELQAPKAKGSGPP